MVHIKINKNDKVPIRYVPKKLNNKRQGETKEVFE